jgi:hypothetical protein
VPDIDSRFNHHPFLQIVAQSDVDYVIPKDTSYGASWKKSGGRSAWFMLKRKIDRLVEMLRSPDVEQLVREMQRSAEMADQTGATTYLDPETAMRVTRALTAEDVFAKIASEPPTGEDGTVLAEIRDLRRYLLLVEAEMMARGVVPAPPGSEEPRFEDFVPKLYSRVQSDVREVEDGVLHALETPLPPPQAPPEGGLGPTPAPEQPASQKVTSREGWPPRTAPRVPEANAGDFPEVEWRAIHRSWNEIPVQEKRGFLFADGTVRFGQRLLRPEEALAGSGWRFTSLWELGAPTAWTDATNVLEEGGVS